MFIAFYANVELIFKNTSVKIVVSVSAYLHFTHLFCSVCSKLEVTIPLMSVRSDVFSLLTATIVVFWDIMPRTLVDRYNVLPSLYFEYGVNIFM